MSLGSGKDTDRKHIEITSTRHPNLDGYQGYPLLQDISHDELVSEMRGEQLQQRTRKLTLT